MDFSTLSLREFTDLLSSKAPVPGGGGASALAGALGVALANMVGALTVGKKKYAAVEEEMINLRAKCDLLQKELLGLIERDAEVFEPLSRAYSLPKETDKERAEKEQVMEAALLEASLVPMQIMEKCAEALELIRVFAEKGSRLAVSDAGAAAVLCCSATKAASLNVYINARSMKNLEQARALTARADDLLAKYEPLAGDTFSKVLASLR